MILATPVAIGIAIFLTEIAPFKIRNFFSINIELLAAIPSIVYGMWGFLYFVPLIQKLFGGTGMGLLTGGIVLSIMILPFIASVTRDSMQTTPIIVPIKNLVNGINNTIKIINGIARKILTIAVTTA